MRKLRTLRKSELGEQAEIKRDERRKMLRKMKRGKCVSLQY